MKAAEIYWGTAESGGLIYRANPTDGCPYPNRRAVKWNHTPIQRRELSSPLQKTLASSLTVFRIRDTKSFFTAINRLDLIPENEAKVQQSYSDFVLSRISQLSDKEFEYLVTEVLKTLGFVDAEHTGRTGDGGVDVKGVLNVYGIVEVELLVQVKQYKIGRNVSAKDVRSLRQNIGQNQQGAFITSSDFQKGARDVGRETNFQRIGTMNGQQFVDLLSDKWEELEDLDDARLKDILSKLRLTRGLRLEE